MNATRRRARYLALLVVATLALLAVAACGDDDDDDAPPSTDEVDPEALVVAAADRMESVERFHFVLEHENGATEIVRDIEMERAEGDVDGATRLQAEIEGTFLSFRFELGIVVLPGEGWIQNPLRGGRWEREEITIDSLFDPQQGVVALMRSARTPEIVGQERVDGVETYRVEATVDSAELTIFPGAEPGRSVSATAWIGVEEALVHRLEISGPIADGESEEIVRRLELSRFGEDVDIVPPR